VYCMRNWATTYRSDFGVSAQSNAEAHAEAFVAPKEPPRQERGSSSPMATEIASLEDGDSRESVEGGVKNGSRSI
jgi:hypothetical protein